VTGRIPLPPPSPGVAAKLCKCTEYWVQVALNGGNAHGRNGHDRNGNNKTSSLAERLLHSTPTERVEAARAFGLARLWDEMLCPAMAEEDLDHQSKAAK
jgi:hypothetical protein